MKLNYNLEQKLANLNEEQYKCFFKNYPSIANEILTLSKSSNLFNRSIDGAFDLLNEHNQAISEIDDEFKTYLDIDDSFKTKTYLHIEISSDRNIDRKGVRGLILSISKGNEGFIVSIGNIAIKKSYTYKEFFKTSIEWIDDTPLDYYLIWPKEANGNMLFNNFKMDLSTCVGCVRCTNMLTFLNNHDPSKFRIDINSIEAEFIESINSFISNYIDKLDDLIRQSEVDKINVKQKVSSLVLSEFDKDSDGRLDLIQDENVLMDLLRKHEKEILDFDHGIIQKIVKLNKYLDLKRDNLNIIFENLKKIDNQRDLDTLHPILRQSMDNYQAIFIHALNMVVCIKSRELVAFYEIYEGFDEMGVFYSNWEIEVSEKLSTMSFKLDSVVSSLRDLMQKIDSLESTVAFKLDKLTYVTGSSFKTLELSLTSELQSIRSGIGLNNLLTGINTYQLYQLNKRTKKLIN